MLKSPLRPRLQAPFFKHVSQLRGSEADESDWAHGTQDPDI